MVLSINGRYLGRENPMHTVHLCLWHFQDGMAIMRLKVKFIQQIQLTNIYKQHNHICQHDAHEHGLCTSWYSCTFAL